MSSVRLTARQQLLALLKQSPDVAFAEPALGWTYWLLQEQLRPSRSTTSELKLFQPFLGQPPAEVYANLQALSERESVQHPSSGGAEPHTREWFHAQRRLRLEQRQTRRQRGRYYTSPALARVLVRLTLWPWLERGEPEQLLRLQVLDPALGAGVFLHETALLLAERLCQRLRLPLHEGVEQVARHCLWGLDIEPVAVKLTIRGLVWLARSPALEPVLSERLRLANTLVGTEPPQLPWSDAERLAPEQLQLLCQAWTVEALEGGATGLAQQGLAQRSSAEQGLAQQGLAQQGLAQQGLAQQGSAEQAWQWLLQSDRLARVQVRAQAEKSISMSWLGRAGHFDVVVGNPPYLSEARGGAALVLQLKRSPRTAAEYQPRGDLFYPFLSLGSRLLEPGGRLGMLVPPYWRSRASASTLRERLRLRMQEVVRVEFGEWRLFMEAPGHHSEGVVWQAGQDAPPLSVCSLAHIKEEAEVWRVLQAFEPRSRTPESGRELGRRACCVVRGGCRRGG